MPFVAQVEGRAGIVGYGAYVPRLRLPGGEIARMWGAVGFPVKEKSVLNYDEDSATMAVEAARYALRMANTNPSRIGAVLVGTESKVYAAKTTGTTVAEALGIGPHYLATDHEFACKAGTEAMIECIALVAAGFIDYGLAIGVDAAQGRPGDDLEYTAGCGAAAFLIGGSPNEYLARIEAYTTFASDTPDFWRREGQRFPRHGARFTGAPAYFRHVLGAARAILEALDLKPSDFKYAVFHQPNVKFPLRAAKALGFSKDQVLPGLLCDRIGNTYAASSPMGLAAVLDKAQPGDRILVVSYGSGAGSDALILTTTNKLPERRTVFPGVEALIARRKLIDYAIYARNRAVLREVVRS